MKNKRVLLLVLVLIAASGAVQPTPCSAFPSRAEASPAGVRVTFVGNSGFMITIGGKKILIDAMFVGNSEYRLPQDVQDALADARPPFDGVDVILVTHNHGDHFNAPMVRQHLKNNSKARLISTAQVTGQLADFGDRVIPLAATNGKPAQKEVDGIQVEAIYLSHGPVPAGREEIVNFGYIASVDGINLFHTGDAYTRVIDMTVPLSPGKPIDLAFIPHMTLDDEPFNRKIVQEWIKGRYIFPIHYAYTMRPLDRAKIKSSYPDAILFDKELQSWDMRK